MSKNETILVTSASGQLGQLVLKSLLQQGQFNLIGTTRSPEKLDDFAKKGVDIRTADHDQSNGLAEAFKGATRLLLISGTEVGMRVQQHKNAIDAAKKAGIKHIIYTSLHNVEKDTSSVAPDHRATESYIRESGLKFTFLRHDTYAEILMFSLPNGLETGVLYGCAGNGKVAYVTRQDCANAAAGALINATHYENKALDITGPESFSRAEVASLVNEIKKSKIIYKDLPPEEYKAALLKSGLPEKYAELFTSYDLSTKKGTYEAVSGGVKELSGKAPQDLRSYLKVALK